MTIVFFHSMVCLSQPWHTPDNNAFLLIVFVRGFVMVINSFSVTVTGDGRSTLVFMCSDVNAVGHEGDK